MKQIDIGGDTIAYRRGQRRGRGRQGARVTSDNTASNGNGVIQVIDAAMLPTNK
jgi:hypothetical protein